MYDKLLAEQNVLAALSRASKHSTGENAAYVVANSTGFAFIPPSPQNVTTNEVKQILSTLERIEILLKEMNMKSAQTVNIETDDENNDENDIELRELTLSETKKELKSYIDQNPGTYMVSDLMSNLKIHPSVLIPAIDNLIKTGEIENVE